MNLRELGKLLTKGRTVKYTRPASLDKERIAKRKKTLAAKKAAKRPKYKPRKKHSSGVGVGY